MGEEMAASVIYQLSKGGYLSVNIFVDLLLCSLFMFFINYHPKKYFQGKKLIRFRLLAILPVIYEEVSIFLKIESILGKIILPIPIYPLLTTKPPMTFLFFIFLAFFIKRRERVFVKHGNKSLTEYAQFLKSNSNSLHFSIFTSLAILITAVIDILLLFGIAAIIFAVNPDIASVVNESSDSVIAMEKFMQNVTLIYGLGIGKSFMLIFTIPFVLLFSYTKTYKNASVDRAIPLIGMGLVVFIFFEGIFQLLKLLPSILG